MREMEKRNPGNAKLLNLRDAASEIVGSKLTWCLLGCGFH